MKLLLYFADGFAWEYCQETDFMAGFWTVRRSLKTLLGYSSTILPSMLSGKYPRETGIWTEYYYDPRPETMLERILTSSGWLLIPANLIRLVLFRVARKLGSPTAHRLRIPLQFAHLYKRHPIDYRKFPPIELSVPTLDQVFSEAGLQVDLRDLAHGFDVPTELDHLRAKCEEIDVFFYFDHQMDSKGHQVGASPERLQPEMDRIASFLSQAWTVLGGADECEMILFSDHGMTDVETTFDLLHALRDFTIGKDYLVFIDSSFARFWFPNPQQRQPILNRLADAPGKFLTAEDLREHGLDFDDDRYGQEIMIAAEGVVFHPNYISPSFFRTRMYPDRGTHGYWPEFPSSYGLFAYRGSRWQMNIPDPVLAVDVFAAVNGILASVNLSNTSNLEAGDVS